MDHILVATDFSPRSDRAMRRAVLIARKTGAFLTLLHVVESDRPERLVLRDRDETLTLLEDFAQTLREEDGVKAQPIVIVDDVPSGILEAAQQLRPDLIVLGPHRSSLRGVFAGTTVERIVRRSVLPVLVAVRVPSSHHSRAMLALNFDEASKSAARAALAMGVFEHTDVLLMHAFDAPAEGMLRRALDTEESVGSYMAGQQREASMRMQVFIDELDLPPAARRVAALVGTPARSIVESAIRENTHLIVMGASQRTGIERAIVGSVTESVIRDAHCDVLVVPIGYD